MKNKYLLKSSINNAHKIICQDNTEVILEKIDSTFAKLLHSSTHSLDSTGEMTSHIKGLNLLSKKSLFMNYSNDEVITKMNHKANENPTNPQAYNAMILEKQKKNAEILSKHLHASEADMLTQHRILATTKHNKMNKNFFHIQNSEQHHEAIHNKTDLHSNLSKLKNIFPKRDENKETTSYAESKVEESNILVLVNPYRLRDYSFTIPEYITLILNVTTKSNLLVYCPLDLSSPLESSEVNYLFPIVFNTANKLAAQIPLSIMDYPDFHKQKLSEHVQ